MRAWCTTGYTAIAAEPSTSAGRLRPTRHGGRNQRVERGGHVILGGLHPTTVLRLLQKRKLGQFAGLFASMVLLATDLNDRTQKVNTDDCENKRDGIDYRRIRHGQGVNSACKGLREYSNGTCNQLHV
jgi:hypothetical protein